MDNLVISFYHGVRVLNKESFFKVALSNRSPGFSLAAVSVLVLDQKCFLIVEPLITDL